MKALVINTIGHGFDVEEVEIATPVIHENQLHDGYESLKSGTLNRVVVTF
jgi:hypothetical protein